MRVAWCLTVVTGGPSPLLSPLSSLANEAGSEREQRGVRLTGQWPSASNSPPRSSPRFHLIDVSQLHGNIGGDGKYGNILAGK